MCVFVGHFHHYFLITSSYLWRNQEFLHKITNKPLVSEQPYSVAVTSISLYRVRKSNEIKLVNKNNVHLSMVQNQTHEQIRLSLIRNQTYEKVHIPRVLKTNSWTSTSLHGSEITPMNKYTSPRFRNQNHEQIHLSRVQKWNSWTSTPPHGPEMKLMNKYTPSGFRNENHEQVHLTRVQNSNSWTSIPHQGSEIKLVNKYICLGLGIKYANPYLVIIKLINTTGTYWK